MITHLNNLKIVKKFRCYHAIQLQDLFKYICQILFYTFSKIQLSTITNWFARQSVWIKTTLNQLQNRIV